MTFSLAQLLIVGALYLLFLFSAAYITDRGWVPARIIHNPVTYTLSLGIYAGVWTFYGAVGLAHDYGYSFLATYFGASAAFILAPVLLLPLLRIARTYQLSSIADLFAFRFRSQKVGTLVTGIMLLAALPLISIQIKAIGDTIHILNEQIPTNLIVFIYCSILAVFAIFFGARHASIRQKHEGLVAAVAAGSLITLLALGGVGLYSLLVIFGGNAGLEEWLARNSLELSFRYSPAEDEAWRTLLLAFFTSAILMPHMFHMMFTENMNPKALRKASWGFPLLLLLLAISVPPILWAGIKLNLASSPVYYGLTIGLDQGSMLLTSVAFIGGLSAASGTLIVSAIALSGMVINHVLLPYYNQGGDQIYERLVWARRAMIYLITLMGFGFYWGISHAQDLAHLGLVSLVAFMQFLPGLLATLFWPGGNRRGFMLGLAVGIFIWLFTMLLPLVNEKPMPMGFGFSTSPWYRNAIYALAANIGVFVIVSWLMKPTPEELHAANSCALNALHRPQGTQLNIESVDDLVNILSPRIGTLAAWREVRQALDDLQIPEDESRPQALSRLRDRLEINLSALLGPVEAVALLTPENAEEGGSYSNKNIHLLENHLEHYQTQLTGLAAELDEVRRYHRMTLQRLPVGVCSVSRTRDILLWNAEMERFTGISSELALSEDLSRLADPWGSLLMDFARKNIAHLHSQKINIDGQPRWFTLHKAAIDSTSGGDFNNQVILVEDETETQMLTNELMHSERLASIGRLAAGVAHEIGNPVTGIACLAQNLRYETENPEVLHSGQQILEQTERIDRIVKSLMNFSHAGNPSNLEEQTRFSIHACTQEAISLVKLDERGKHRQYHNDTDPGHRVLGDPQRLLQVFVNLLNNAADASEPDQEIRIASRQEGDNLLISVEDQGTGIPAELQSRLFEPFFTTKEPGKGTGLGLSLVYSILEEHQGSVQIESPCDKAQNRGTRVLLTLPLANQTQASAHVLADNPTS